GLDTVTLVTGDGDYVPLVDCLKVHGCRVEVVSFERSTAGELIKAADQYIPIQEGWIFKEKKFEAAAAAAASGSPAAASHQYEGLPRDEDLEAEAAAAAAAEQNAAYGNTRQNQADEDEDQP